MRKFLTTAIAALTFGGAVAATAAPAQAHDYYRHDGYYRHHSGSDKAAVAVAAGIAGLALGAALSDGGSRRSRGYSSYSYGYRSNGYAYDPRYDDYYGDYYGRGYYDRPDRICISRERVWDPYIGRRVTIERRYPC